MEEGRGGREGGEEGEEGRGGNQFNTPKQEQSNLPHLTTDVP